jgi:quercetin dioxygenase-like cupin family protein
MVITEALQLSDVKPAVLQIKNTEKSNVIAIGLKKDQVLKKHISPIPALLVVLKGSIIFEMEGSRTELKEFSTFEIPVNVLHEVTGITDSIFLVIKEKS